MPLTLDVAQRTAVGRPAHRLRREGLIPGIVYGHKVEPLAVQIPERELGRVSLAAGVSHLIQLKVKGERRQRPVLIRELQREPRGGHMVHVDFFQVNLTEKLNVTVPVVLTGESPAVKLSVGELLQVVHGLEVNCLPDSIPGEITIDISGLAEVDDAVRIGEISLPEGVELTGTADPEEILVKIAATRVSVEEPEALEAEAAAEATEESAPPAAAE
ncbi:MAG: 50S ribosomal protein L25 [Candidatus Dormiibacterota bacterium]